MDLEAFELRVAPNPPYLKSSDPQGSSLSPLSV
jgi:hypothetical protein